ncbi:MAG: saccharopine dehydrogenase NADP-binding domain-containing protein [Saprospiraceae bacterium]|nr:saccharopine dehydrogenase NADP-binding domain-containing protein [Saprospiraceae bacterium]
MNEKKKVIIAGTGGIGEATAILLANHYRDEVRLLLGNRTFPKALKLVDLMADEFSKVDVQAFHLPEGDIGPETKKILEMSHVLLDCLPGDQAPRMARMAMEHGLHYANLTEYVDETNEIIEMAAGNDSAFILQTGLAPGFINVLAHALFNQFCNRYQVGRVQTISMKVGALTKHAVSPHFYGFTWSPVGVATEYLKGTECLRNYEKTRLQSLSERQSVVIGGIAYEEDLTSGGSADLPDFFLGKVRSLEYKTLRYPGHYKWIQSQLSNLEPRLNPITQLQTRMEKCIPRVEDDIVIIYCLVEGPDKQGIQRLLDKNYTIKPMVIGNLSLRAIQTSTAAPLAECARLLLTDQFTGVVQQSQIDPTSFMDGPFVSKVYNHDSVI